MVTPMTQGFRDNQELHEDLLEGIPQGRGGDPAEAGQAALFLALDESYCNGTSK
jgi:NAD(P)-dependent dehydrogenase (short-subunit alcohol dehydrogenase family)